MITLNSTNDVVNSTLPVWAKTIALNLMTLWNISGIQYDDVHNQLSFVYGSWETSITMTDLGVLVQTNNRTVTVPSEDIIQTLYTLWGGKQPRT